MSLQANLQALQDEMTSFGAALVTSKEALETGKSNVPTVATAAPTAAQGNNGDIWYQVDP